METTVRASTFVPEQAQPASQQLTLGLSLSDYLPGIRLQEGFRFRRGQEAFLAKLAVALDKGEMNHLGVFVPGYGKTITALASFVIAHAMGLARKLVVFVPRGNLRDQYADPEELAQVMRWLGAPPFSFCVADSDRIFLKNLRTQIIITTYQYASGDGGNKALQQLCEAAPCMFIFDEVHHLSEDGLWASKIEQLDHTCSVALSGTPIRSDNKALFGVPFEPGENGEQYYHALHEVTLRDAHREGRILKRVEAHVFDYRLEMIRQDTGEQVSMTLSEMIELSKEEREIDVYLARRKLRFHEVYLDTLLRPAFDCLAEKQAMLKDQADGRPGRGHQMLVIAMSNMHAAAILAFIQRTFPQFSATRIGQDIAAPQRAMRLQQYRDGYIDVMVQVDMIGEGTDIKPISVIVKADLVRAYSKTIQQIFRGMRYFSGFPQQANRCDIFAADDAEVVRTLEWITTEAKIGVRQAQEATDRKAPPAKAPSEQSVWELKDVQHRHMQTHRLDQLASYQGNTPDTDTAIVDVASEERKLRKACAELAAELKHVLAGRGQFVEIWEIHARAKDRLSKAQEELSLNGLRKKKRWLERCLRDRRLM